MTHPIATLPATCTNCGATLHGRYCHSCGQKSVSSRLSLREFAHEAVHELAHLDGKIVQTLKRLRAQINYRYEATDSGARLVITTANTNARTAIHQFLRFQIKDHQTGDSREIEKSSN